MSRIYVDRISPYQSGSVQVDGLSLDTGSLATKAEFNTYTASNDGKVNSLIAATSSYQPAGNYATTGSNTFTAKQTVNDYVEQNFDAPTTNQEKAFVNISSAAISGKNYGRVFYGIADYPSAGQNYEDYFAIEYYDGLSYNFGSEFDINGKQTQLYTKASGSGQESYIRTIDNYNGTSQVTINSGNKIVLNGSIESTGNNSFNGNQIVTGSVQQTFDAPAQNNEVGFVNINNASISGKNYNRTFWGIADYSGVGANYEDYFTLEYYDGLSYNFGSEFNINGKQTQLYTKASGSGQESYIRTTDNYDGTSQISIGSGNKTVITSPVILTGSLSSNDLITQNISAPTTNQEKAFVNVSGAAISGKNYNRVYFGIADYPGSGQTYEDYFAIEYYDSVSFNFGSEFNVNGKNTLLSTSPSGSGFSGRAYVQTVDNYDGTADVNIASNSGRVNIQSVMRLSAQDPLPAGALGDLAVSGSDLYFHNGTSWIQK